LQDWLCDAAAAADVDNDDDDDDDDDDVLCDEVMSTTATLLALHQKTRLVLRPKMSSCRERSSRS